MSKQKVSYLTPLIVLMVNLFIIMVGIGLVIPIVPYYIEAFNASGRELGFLIAIFAFMQFLFAPIWGRLSDKIGRKPLVALGMFGFAAGEFIFAYASGLWMLFLSRAVAGIFGSALMPTAMAFVADVTPEKDRGKGMGMLGAAMALGIVIGPGIGGWLAEIELNLPFILAGIAAALGGIVSIFFLPESLSAEDKETAKQQEKTSLLLNMASALKSEIGFLLILIFTISFALANFQAIFGFYMLKKFGYDPSEVGILVAVTGIVGVVVQGTLIGRLTNRFGEKKVVKGSLLLSAIGFLSMTFAFNYATVLLTISLFFLGNSLVRPSVNALLSKMAGQNQGMVMGLNNSFLSLGNAIGPVLAGLLFEWNLELPYWFGAFLMLVTLIGMRVWLSKSKTTVLRL
ncbi:MFS transporter [Fictibacillus barbaricus]|uniref:MFS transporter n=1 Tax=Fictibacillus barbaricus TaxID=182136 RepID=A0ABS2Z9Y4_9BACL|nr:MFS transporter [Fictibacillus barbaricus]MBN3544531.1 MFS transporter [Fictibacillus barbaricus]GGB65977.1 tetracycline resistance MFS efflux pump [Fictibacillus barbaricus]